MSNQKYRAFISYSHGDNQELGREWATWLQSALETFEIPSQLIGTSGEAHAKIPESLAPVFLDQNELGLDADLSDSLKQNLLRSETLIVLCSPNSARSRYVQQEIEVFMQMKPNARIVPVIIKGEPYISESSEDSIDSEECLPIPLRYKRAKSGIYTDEGLETIAADFRFHNGTEKVEGWTSADHLNRKLMADGMSFEAARNASIKYGQTLAISVLKVAAAILGLPVSVLSERGSNVKRLADWQRFASELVTSPTRSGKAIPPPAQNELWNVALSLADENTIKFRAREKEPAVAKFLRGLVPHNVRPRTVESASWCNDSIYAVTVDAEYIRRESVTDSASSSGRFGLPTIKRNQYVRPNRFERPADGDQAGFLRNFQPQSNRHNNFVLSTTRSLSFWDNKDLYCYELCVDGSVNVFSSYHEDVTEIWSGFCNGDSRAWNGDLIHDIGQVISCSPDGSMVAFRYGSLKDGATSGKGWRIDVWKRTPNDFKRIAQFDDPFPSRSDLRLAWSPSSSFMLVYLEDFSETFVLDVQKSQSRVLAGGKTAKCNPVWHPTRDWVVIGASEGDQSNEKQLLSFWEASSGDCLQTLASPHSQDVFRIAISVGGRFLATSSFDESVNLHDLEQNESSLLAPTKNVVMRFNFSPDGKRLLVEGLNKKNTISIYDVEHRRKICEFDGCIGNVVRFPWHPDGQKIMSCPDEYTIEVRELAFSSD